MGRRAGALSVSQLLVELGMEEFEPAICCRLGADSAERIRSVRYEELLEMGLSKVQCHLFLQKVSSLVGPNGIDPDRIISVGGGTLADFSRGLEAMNQSSAHCGRQGGREHGAMQEEEGEDDEDRLALQRMLMPPPRSTSPFPGEAAGLSRKRAHSSHWSTAGATADLRGSERQLSTAGSASGSSSSSLHLEIRVKKRRRVTGRRPWSGDERLRGSEHGPPSSSRGRGVSSTAGDPEGGGRPEGAWEGLGLEAGMLEQALQEVARQEPAGDLG
mmetsp:Transcript_75549/g.245656  ORF Transcript_75549/g.245656 Transcript_75549/m.245656 type:complete len:273 (+) Transcript_75549:81-899(+)